VEEREREREGGGASAGRSDALRRVLHVVDDAAAEFIHKRGRAYPRRPPSLPPRLAPPPAPPPLLRANAGHAAAQCARRDLEMRARCSPEEPPFVFRERERERERERGRSLRSIIRKWNTR